jgi:hypothetical protein
MPICPLRGLGWVWGIKYAGAACDGRLHRIGLDWETKFVSGGCCQVVLSKNLKQKIHRRNFDQRGNEIPRSKTAGVLRAKNV